MYNLDSQSIDILADIINKTESIRDGVDALAYRASHDYQLDVLDKLEADGYLRRENDKYWISLTALPLIKDKKVEELLDNFDKIFLYLKRYYKENQRDHISLHDLATRVALPVEIVKECLSYMVEGSWWGGRSTDFYSGDNPHIKPSESILNPLSCQCAP